MNVEGGKNEWRILRSGPKPKFIKSEYEEVTGANFVKMVEKILGGDARSNMLRQGLPIFSGEL
jgi:hypothetical protein